MGVSYKDKIKSALAKAAKLVGGNLSPLVVRNADQSVDGELRIPLAKGKDEYSAIRALQETPIADNVWFTVGTRYTENSIPDDSKDRYLRWRGYREAVQAFDTNYAKGEVFERALSVAKKMRKAFRRKPSEVVIRLKYDPRTPASRHVKKAGLAPARKGSKAKPRKRKAKKKTTKRKK